jgi:spore germination cell wall hydrolase CwlJ-like protein
MITLLTLRKTLLAALIAVSLPLASHPVPKPLPTKEVRCLVDNVYHEARGEPWEGQVLVARVTLNRATSTSICTEVYKPKQFSWTIKPNKIDRHSPAYTTAWHAAYAAIGTKYEATYYHSIKVHPRWAKKLTRVTTIGNHTFYRDKTV